MKLPAKGPQLGTIIWLLWRDHASIGAWKPSDFKAEPSVIETVGFLHEWGASQIVVCQSIDRGVDEKLPGPRYNKTNSVVDLIVILRPCILDWCVIKE